MGSLYPGAPYPALYAYQFPVVPPAAGVGTTEATLGLASFASPQPAAVSLGSTGGMQ